MTKNVYTIDATTIDSNGVVVPKDLSGDPADAHSMTDAHVRSAWAIKVVNDADEAVDLQPLVTTSDDETFDEYVEDGPTETINTGNVPDNTGLVTGETVSKHIGAELTASTTPTAGTVKVVFNTRRYG